MHRLKKGIKKIAIIAVLLSNIGCDQITKKVARDHIDYGEQITIIADLLTITKVENTGAFLSLGNSLPSWIKIPLLMVLPSIVLVGMLILILRQTKIELNYAIAIAFIIGGGVGNLFDRILYGSVTDFLYMDLKVFHTGIFNMADVSIVIGSLWIILMQLSSPRNKQFLT